MTDRERIIKFCWDIVETIHEMEKLDGVRDFTNGQKSTALTVISFIEEMEGEKDEPE